MHKTVNTVEELQKIVETVTEFKAFAFDIESRGVLERHDDVNTLFKNECKEHIATLKNPIEDVVARSTEAIRQRYLSTLALDPFRNEVFWLGIATHGHSWAIPMGHSVGEIIVPEQIGDGTVLPPLEYRKVLKNGSVSTAKTKFHVPATYSDPPEQLSRYDVFETLRPIFFSDSTKVGHNVKFDALSIQKYYGELPHGPYRDTMILQHVCDENFSSFSLTNLIFMNFDTHSPYAKEGKLGKIITSVPFSKASRYVHLDARWTWMLYIKLMAKLKAESSLIPVMEQDMEVMRVLMSMEQECITVDSYALKQLIKELDNKLNDTLLLLSEVAYPGFNPDSNKDKQLFLFNKKRDGGLGLKPTKKTPKGAPSVDTESLESLQGKHPIIPLLLTWSETQKLKNTYVDGLLPKLNNNKLHPSFNLHRTATGRLSSSSPNLQNVPRDSSIRGLFVPPDWYTMLVADYDQIELRVMAMFSQDKRLLEIFKNNEDIHTATAAAVFKKDITEITSEERQIGKGVNFLTAYGGGSNKLARVTGITAEHAEEILASYYKSFSGLTRWKQVAIATATKRGYTTTISGRRRRLLDLTSRSSELVSRAQRQAINAIIQGSAADICKQAMIYVDLAFRSTNSKMLVQVHDELVAIAPEDEEESAISTLINAMGHNKTIMGVTLNVSCHAARSWAEAKQ